MKSDPELRPADIARIAIELQRSERYKDKELCELIDEACYLLLSCGERAPIAKKDYEQRKAREAAAAAEIIPPTEVAKLVTSQSATADALKRFERFVKFLSEPNDLVVEWERIQRWMQLKGAKNGYRKELCDWLTELYPRWWDLHQRRLQSIRGSGGAQKKSKKVS